jgi:hypothetical protein
MLPILLARASTGQAPIPRATAEGKRAPIASRLRSTASACRIGIAIEADRLAMAHGFWVRCLTNV